MKRAHLVKPGVGIPTFLIGILRNAAQSEMVCQSLVSSDSIVND